ncbi:TIGR02391 family protein [Paenibacillus alvei]|uniref:TIGR02391 family protein n=1 Tax=Paenibacillus alvei TaxID=44250 RepID=UPI0018CDE989|nr:TIGR02391 family protein [Paenibacillus alvei]MCY9578731.1 TIGR02391 family protein [Paenibacillus alvei]MCY9583789.1 TIGR02391 family protein [Paenibacillus alvei]
MTSEIQCPLCGYYAVLKRDGSEVYQIVCPSCGEFQITQDCFDDLPAERKLQPQLMKVSVFTRSRAINKDPIPTLFIGDPGDHPEGYSIQQIIDQFPSISDRKWKALSNLKGLSKYFGDAILIETKDYPVFYPEVNQEQPCQMMMRTLVGEGLVTGEAKIPTHLTVTEKGVSLLEVQASSAAIAAPVVTPPAPKAPVIEELTPVAVQSSKLEGLHPRVLEVAQKLFHDGHFRSAVLDTYVALDNDVQRKSRLAATGKPLMDSAFSKNSPVLKLSDAPDAQLGAMLLFSGAVMGVRNVLAHDQKANPSEQEALELLHFASTLFRRLDQAVNVEVEKLMVEISQLSFKLDGNASFSNSAKIRKYLVPSREYVDSGLHRLCFEKILMLIRSGYFNDQNAGIDLLLEWDETLLDHVTDDDHIELITYIYKAAGGSYPSHSAEDLIRGGFKPIARSLRLFQKHLLFSAEVFHELLEKIWWKDAFFRSIVNYADIDFLVVFLNKLVDRELVLNGSDMNNLSYKLNHVGRTDIKELTDKINKMNKES